MSEFSNFDRAAEYYDETRGFPAGDDVKVAAWIAETVDLSPSHRLLEVGIGTGRIAVPLSAHVKSIDGIDISRAMLAKLRAKQSVNPVHVIEGDATFLPYADNTFDACLSIHVFHLIPDMDSCIQEINRVLKPDGVLLYGGGPADVRGESDTGTSSFADLEAVWNKYAPPAVGAGKMEDVQGVLRRHGWHIPDAPLKYEGIIVKRKPSGFIDGLRQRKRSASWRMSDETLNAAVAEMEKVARENYADPDALVDIEAAFYLTVYRRV
jgi:SAM-dependent methyltransferase